MCASYLLVLSATLSHNCAPMQNQHLSLRSPSSTTFPWCSTFNSWWKCASQIGLNKTNHVMSNEPTLSFYALQISIFLPPSFLSITITASKDFETLSSHFPSPIFFRACRRSFVGFLWRNFSLTDPSAFKTAMK